MMIFCFFLSGLFFDGKEKKQLLERKYTSFRSWNFANENKRVEKALELRK